METQVKNGNAISAGLLYLPAMMPENLDQETMESLKTGKGIKLPKDAKVVPCLLKKENGE